MINKYILQVCPEYNFCRVFLLPGLKFLRAQGFNITFAAKITEKDDSKEIPEFVKDLGLNTTLTLNPFKLISNFYKTIKIFKQENPHVVHSHMMKSSSIALIAAKIAGVPIRIYNNHGFTYIGYTGPLRFLLRTIELVNIKYSTHVLTDSITNARYAENDGLAKPGSIHVYGIGAAGGIDIEKAPTFDEAESKRKDLPFTVAYVGRPHKRKGFDLALLAFEKSGLYEKGCKMLVAGCTEKDAEKILKRKIAGVEYLGHVKNMSEFYSRCHVLMLPSKHEGFGQCVIEAAAFGIPSLGSNIPGIDCAIVDGETGLLHSFGDIEKLTQDLISTYENPEFRKKLGIAARHRVEKFFSKDFICGEMLKFYQKIDAEMTELENSRALSS